MKVELNHGEDGIAVFLDGEKIYTIPEDQIVYSHQPPIKRVIIPSGLLFHWLGWSIAFVLFIVLMFSHNNTPL